MTYTQPEVITIESTDILVEDLQILLEDYLYVFNLKEITDKMKEFYDDIKDSYNYTINDTDITKDDIIQYIKTSHNFFLSATPVANRHGRTLGLEKMAYIAIIIFLFNIHVENDNIVNRDDENFILHILSLYNIYISEKRETMKILKTKTPKTICTISNKYLKYKHKYLKYKSKYPTHS
jgi:hypothetical protein